MVGLWIGVGVCITGWAVIWGYHIIASKNFYEEEVEFLTEEEDDEYITPSLYNITIQTRFHKKPIVFKRVGAYADWDLLRENLYTSEAVSLQIGDYIIKQEDISWVRITELTK